jgi:hypothetical protein
MCITKDSLMEDIEKYILVDPCVQHFPLKLMLSIYCGGEI